MKALTTILLIVAAFLLHGAGHSSNAQEGSTNPVGASTLEGVIEFKWGTPFNEVEQQLSLSPVVTEVVPRRDINMILFKGKIVEGLRADSAALMFSKAGLYEGEFFVDPDQLSYRGCWDTLCARLTRDYGESWNAMRHRTRGGTYIEIGEDGTEGVGVTDDSTVECWKFVLPSGPSNWMLLRRGGSNASTLGLMPFPVRQFLRLQFVNGAMYKTRDKN